MKQIKKEKMCLIFSDASFSVKDNVSIISFLNINCNEKKQKRITSKNILEAEKEAILFALKSSLSKCKNIVVFSDNLYAVLYFKKQILSKKNSTPFRILNYLDVVWVPREYNLADFFTKFLDNNFLIETLNEKLKIIENRDIEYKNIYEELNSILSKKEAIKDDDDKD